MHQRRRWSMYWEPIDGRWLGGLPSLTWHSSDLHTEDGDCAFTAPPPQLRCSVSPTLVTSFLLQLDSRFVYLCSLSLYSFFPEVSMLMCPLAALPPYYTYEYLNMWGRSPPLGNDPPEDANFSGQLANFLKFSSLYCNLSLPAAERESYP